MPPPLTEDQLIKIATNLYVPGRDTVIEYERVGLLGIQASGEDVRPCSYDHAVV